MKIKDETVVKSKEVWKRNLFVLSAAQFVYRAGTRSLIPFLPLFIQDLGNTSTVSAAIWSGWIFAVPFIVSFFTTPLWGSFGDRYGRKLMTIISVFGFALSQYLMGSSANLTQLLIFAAFQEALGGFYPAAVSLTASNTPKENTAYALGVIQFANGAGNVVGPVIGGLLAVIIGYREVFYLVAGVVGSTGIIILLFIREENFSAEKQSYLSLLQNLKYIFNEKVLFASALFLLIYSLSVSVIRPTFPLFIAELSSVKNVSSITGIILGIYGGTSAVASALFGKLIKKKNIITIFYFVAITASATSVLIGFFHSITILIILLSAGGFAVGLILPLIFTLISNHTEQERKAGVFGLGSSFMIVGNFGGSIVAGYIVSLIGLSFPFIAAGLLFFLILPVIRYSLKNYQD